MAAQTTLTASEVQVAAMKTARFNVEVIAGVPIEKPLPKRTHQKVMQRIYDLLRAVLPDTLDLYQELNYICGGDLTIPDVCVCSADATFENDDLASSAVLCVEVISPGQTLGMLFLKCEAYHQAGTPECWVIDPLKRRAWTYSSNGELQSTDSSVNVSISAVPFSVDLSRLFEVV